MASMNNWLAFSLSPQELPPSQAHQSHPSPAAVSRIISGDDVSAHCYGLAPHTSPALGIPNGAFGVLEAFNRQQHQQPPQEQQVTDWNSLKGLDYKGSSSELSMLVGSSSSTQINMTTDEPKLEDFLGGNSFSDHGQKLPAGCNSMTGAYDSPADYMFSNCSLQPAATITLSASDGGGGGVMAIDGGTGNGGSGGSSIGLSMIKTWLRNQPAPLQQDISRSGGEVVRLDGAGCETTPSSVGNGATVAGNAQSLSLSMSTGSQSRSTLPLMAASGSGGGESSSSADNKQKDGGGAAIDPQTGAIDAGPRKSIDTFGQRTSIYRGLEWDVTCSGGYDKEEKAARAYDLAALKYWGTTTTTNFPISNYEKELEEMKHMTRQEFVASLRRKSSGFSRVPFSNRYRHHQHGRWQARIGRVAGNKDLYLGTFSTQEEAAEAYDIAAIKFRGLNAVTNFDMSRYDVKSIMESTNLPIGGASKRLGEASAHSEATVDGRRGDVGDSVTSHLAGAVGGYLTSHGHHGWPGLAFPQAAAQSLAVQYAYGAQQQRGWCKQEQDGGGVALQDLHQLHLGGCAAHNFFQPSALHGLAGVDSSSMELSSGSSSVIYGSSGGGGGGSSGIYQGNVAGNNSFAVPYGTVVADQSHAPHGNGGFGENEVKQLAYEGLLTPADPYPARNVYYLSQQSSSTGAVKANGYEQNPNSSTWMTNSVQAFHGGSTFSVWNES
ncbi:hypothetical protein Taro_013453 [Colocasia esculenta]|uniref:AP2/ERF domain-containing protein n=1 Tax=Colocasia esculenta TaxID=4460 RepID=A0A843UFM0_COLES|nr:hypothetical protein [Colocasia esculenta]